ncbi:MAG: response regulator [Raoultibacter sp.]|jgi:two-component system response regulator NreC
MIRVVIADDHEVVRAGVRALLERSIEDVTVVAEAADGSEAYSLVAREKPDLLLMDISMPPGESGLIACERVTRDFPKTKVIILTMFAESEYLFFTLRGGASGYVLKTASPEELTSAVKTVHGGGTYIHPKMTEALARQLISPGSDQDLSYKTLTTRELEILQLLAKGYTNKEVSEKVFLSVKTVEAHRSKIYSKLGFSTRSELVSYALRHKLLDI